jgi:hypothetical protein
LVGTATSKKFAELVKIQARDPDRETYLAGITAVPLDLDLCALLEQARDHDQGHCRKMTAEHPAISLSDFLLPRHVGRLVSDEPGQSREMATLTACLRQHLHDACKSALNLRDKILTHQFAALAPADLTGDEDLTSLGGNAVGIPFGASQFFGCRNSKLIADFAVVI